MMKSGNFVRTNVERMCVLDSFAPESKATTLSSQRPNWLQKRQLRQAIDEILNLVDEIFNPEERVELLKLLDEDVNEVGQTN